MYHFMAGELLYHWFLSLVTFLGSFPGGSQFYWLSSLINSLVPILESLSSMAASIIAWVGGLSVQGFTWLHLKELHQFDDQSKSIYSY